jgi:hypothetical protein
VSPTIAARTRRRGVGPGFVLAFGLLVAANARHATAGDPPQNAAVIYHNSRSFRIPFNINPAEKRRIKEVLLIVSENRGLTWKPVEGRTTPDRGVLGYRAPSDGEYWFAVQTLDDEGRLYPPTTDDIEPRMKVVVDTIPPTLALRASGRRGTVASVRWEAQDERIDINSFTLEYQTPNTSEWRPVTVARPIRQNGEATWDAGTADSIQVRAQVSDRAKNIRVVTIDLADGVPGNPAVGRSQPSDANEPPPLASFASSEVDTLPQMGERPVEPAPTRTPAVPPSSRPASPEPMLPTPEDLPSARPSVQPAPAPSNPEDSGVRPRLIPSPRFNLQYQVEDAGPEGPATLELWVTQDGGRTWRLAGTDPDRKSPFPVDLGGEGTFGLKIVAKSASDLGDSSPVPGERPSYFVEVDATRPMVKLDRVRVETRAGVATLTVDWRASDFNLGPRPVEVAIRPDTPGGKWQRIGQPVDNNGRASWVIPPSAPTRFFVRVEVADEAGNRGTDESSPNSPVIVDRTRPKGKILGVEPAVAPAPDP